MGNAHFVAAVAALSLNDYAIARREFALFLQEDPSNPLAPAARQNIEALSRVQSAPRIMSAAAQQPAATTPLHRLRARPTLTCSRPNSPRSG